MAAYKIGIGHDVAAIDMDDIVPQPKGGMVKPIEREYGASGVHHQQALYLDLEFGFSHYESDYQNLLVQFGLNGAETAEVTVQAWNDRMYARRYNGTAHRPQVGEDVKLDNFFLRDIHIFITDLEEIL